MQLEILDSAAAVAERVAEIIAQRARTAVAERGCFLVALSGGTGPWNAFRRLATMDLPWPSIHVFQVDERVAPAGDPQRNWTHLEASLLSRVPILPAHAHPMPVERTDLDAAAREYADRMTRVAGMPPVLDLVHLGLGDDGHTASLVPGDPLLDRTDADVGVSVPYRGQRRMTLTFAAINRAAERLWLVSGDAKAGALRSLVDGDERIPAGRVRRDRTCLVTDLDPARRLPSG